MRLGFFIGFLIGAGISAVASQFSDAPDSAEASGPIGEMRSRVRAALSEAKREARAKEEEMRYEFDEALRISRRERENERLRPPPA